MCIIICVHTLTHTSLFSVLCLSSVFVCLLSSQSSVVCVCDQIWSVWQGANSYKNKVFQRGCFCGFRSGCDNGGGGGALIDAIVIEHASKVRAAISFGAKGAHIKLSFGSTASSSTNFLVSMNIYINTHVHNMVFI